MLKTIKCAGVSVAIVLASASLAQSGTFDVKGVDLTKGQAEIGVNSSFYSGFPANAERIRQGFEFGLGYTLTDWWKVGIKFTIDKPVDENHQLSTLGFEQQTLLKKFENGFGLGWFSSVDVAAIQGDPDSTTFGPILQFGTETTSLSLNPFLVKTFGPDRVEGIDFSYGWQVKHQVREGFAFGIEGYGVVPNIANSPGIDFQEHRIGPVLYFERDLPQGFAPRAAGKSLSVKDAKSAGADSGPGKFNLEVGVLFGMTEGTQDVTAKIKGGFTF